MENYDPAKSFGEDTAAIYDDTPRGDEAETVAFLERLAAGGPVLELAIGTGRIALPLAARGLDVAGIDIAPAMVEKLRAKPGGDRIAVTMGNFADVPVEGMYRLIYLVFNTIVNLLTQDEQVRCFENVAAHLTEDGVFVVEAAVAGVSFPHQNYVDAEAVAVNEVQLDVGRYDPVTQLLAESHVHLTPDGVRLYPIVTRYISPAEMDLMARIAGLRLKARWGGWQGEPFTGESKRHVSVYGR
jgi:SAM-dependent methyltransferase